MIEYGSMDVWQCHLSLAVATVYRGGIGSLALINEIQGSTILDIIITGYDSFDII